MEKIGYSNSFEDKVIPVNEVVIGADVFVKNDAYWIDVSTGQEYTEQELEYIKEQGGLL